MKDITFAQIDWFWALAALIPLLALRLVAHFRSSRQLVGLVSPRLADSLISGTSKLRSGTTFLLRLLALVCIITALARPQMGYEEIETEVDVRNLLIAVDTSRSMMADDLPPNRITRAKLAAIDIVTALPDDRVGVIAFAGMAFLQAPFTTDHEAIIESIDQLDSETIPRGGTNLSATVELAIDTVQKEKLTSSVLVVFSDGEDLEGTAELERVSSKAKENGMSILSVGVGTEAGAIIPEVDDKGRIIPGEFVKDDQGQIVRTRLESTSLQTLAKNSGRYIHLGGTGSLTTVVGDVLKGIQQTREEGRATRRPIERFLWPLCAGFALLVLSHLVPLLWRKPKARRSFALPQTSSGLALLLLSLLTPSAFSADPLQSARDAISASNYTEASSAFEGALEGKISTAQRAQALLGLGSSAYLQGDYEQAADAFSSALENGNERIREVALYNLGNSLFRRGETALKATATNPSAMPSATPKSDGMSSAIQDWEAAIEHYESSLALDPKNNKASDNLTYVQRRLEELKAQQQQEQQSQDQQQQNQDQQNQDQQKDQDKDQQQQNQKQNQQQQNQDKQEQDSQQNQGQEQQQDMNQDPQQKNQDQNQDQQESNQKNPQQNDGQGQQQSQDDNMDSSGQDSQKDQSDSKDPKSDKDSNSQPQGEPEPEPDTPPDGELEANPNQQQPNQAPPSNQPNEERAGNAGDQQIHPETGYSASEARHLLDSLSDETEVRPVYKIPVGEGRYKNW